MQSYVQKTTRLTKSIFKKKNLVFAMICAFFCQTRIGTSCRPDFRNVAITMRPVNPLEVGLSAY